MSQYYIADRGSLPSIANIQFIAGNDGIAVGPDPVTHIINVVGDNTQGINVTGNAGTFTNTITALDATTAQKGVTLLATNAEAIAGSVTTKAVTPDDLKAKLGTQTQFALPYGNTQTGALQWLGVATNGQIPIGSTGAAPVLANITSTNGSITITNGPGSIDLALAEATGGNSQTIGAVTADPITLSLGATPGTYALEIRVAGFEASTPAATAFQIFATVRTTGAAAVLVGIPDIITNSEAAVGAALANVVVSGNNAIVRVTGVALLTINWRAELEYTFRG